jgi:hypothetical protein
MAALLVALGVASSSRGAPGGRRLLAVVLASSLLVAVATPWTESRWDPTAVQRAASPDAALRRTVLETDATALLRRRPSHAEAWVHLAWLRLPASREEGRALADWGLSLDPGHEAMARAATPLRDAAR